MRGFIPAVLATAACTSGAPPGFAGGTGDRWAMPLVGPLENGQLITSVQINTHGPYLFAIDPDAPMSMIDAELVKKLDLRSFPGPKRLDESDTQQVRFYAELLGLEIGTLIIERGNTIIVREHTLDGAGRRIMGVLGRDMLADSLAWGFDRDQGLVYVQTQKSFKPPPDATPVVYGELVSRVPNVQTLPPPRRLVDVTINGEKFAMHVDLGATASQLRDGLWEKAKLVPRDVKTVVIDEVGFGRSVSKASEPAPVQLAGSVTGNAVFIPYGDKRWESQDIAGTIGLGFFDNYSVWQSWHTKQYFIVPRKDVPAKTRIARWDSPVFAKCQNVGCVTIRVTDPLAGKALEPGKQHPGLVVSITRDEVAGGMALEVILEATPNSAPPPAAPATDAPAAPAPAAPDPAAPPTTPTAPAPTAPAAPAGPLPRLLVNMPGHVDKMLHQLPATFLNTTLTVVDASPFPRACPTPNGCVDLLAR